MRGQIVGHGVGTGLQAPLDDDHTRGGVDIARAQRTKVFGAPLLDNRLASGRPRTGIEQANKQWSAPVVLDGDQGDEPEQVRERSAEPPGRLGEAIYRGSLDVVTV